MTDRTTPSADSESHACHSPQAVGGVGDRTIDAGGPQGEALRRERDYARTGMRTIFEVDA